MSIDKYKNASSGAGTANINKDENADAGGSAGIAGVDKDENIGDKFSNIITNGVGTNYNWPT